MGKRIDIISRISPEDAARELGMATDSFRQCLKNSAFPIDIGVAFKKPGNTNYSYYIYREPLDRLKQLWGIE